MDSNAPAIQKKQPYLVGVNDFISDMLTTGKIGRLERRYTLRNRMNEPSGLIKLPTDKPATKIDMDALAQEVQDSPDDYQWERAARFNVTQPAITKALKRLNSSYKKNTATSQGQRRGTYQLPTKNTRV